MASQNLLYLMSAGGGVGTSTPAPQQPSEGTYSTFDDSKPVASLTIRLMDGSRLTGRFNSSHTISDVVKCADYFGMMHFRCSVWAHLCLPRGCSTYPGSACASICMHLHDYMSFM